MQRFNFIKEGVDETYCLVHNIAFLKNEYFNNLMKMFGSHYCPKSRYMYIPYHFKKEENRLNSLEIMKKYFNVLFFELNDQEYRGFIVEIINPTNGNIYNGLLLFNFNNTHIYLSIGDYTIEELKNGLAFKDMIDIQNSTADGVYYRVSNYVGYITLKIPNIDVQRLFKNKKPNEIIKNPLE